jgi:hypothetical protein
VGERGDLSVEVRRLTQRVRRLDEERRLLSERRERVLRLGVKPGESWQLRKLTAAQRLSRGLAIASISEAKLEGLDARVVALDGELVEVRRALGAAQLSLSQASSAVEAARGEPTWRAMVHVREPGEGLVVEVTYVVPWACWWPIYALRLSDAGRRAVLQVSALVVQDTDEDWGGVELGLSTADLTLDAQLPVLPALKLGKAQPSKRHGYRPLPEGMDRLFAAYDRAVPALAAAPEPPEPLVEAPVERERGLASPKDADDSRVMRSISPPPPSSAAMPVGAIMPQAAPMVMSMPAAAPKRGGFGMPNLGIMDAMGDLLSDRDGYAEEQEAAPMMERSRKSDASFGGAPGGGGPAKPRPAQGPAEPEGGWLDFDQLRMAGPGADGRGKLYRDARGAAGEDRNWRIDSWQSEAARQGGRDPRVTRGLFDCRYDAAGRVEIPSDGRLHKIDLMRAEGGARLRWRAVPRERAEVYRMAYVVNTLDVPLLDGPIDVFVEGSFLATDTLARVDRGGEFLVGMGVDDRLRVARNAKMEEERAGLLGGKAVVIQRVTIDVRSSLGFDAEVEVLDRLPIPGSDAVTIEALEAQPAASAYTQQGEGSPVEGGQRWLLKLAPGGQSKITFGYKITLSGKEEIVGGNRREP